MIVFSTCVFVRR